MRLRDDLSKEYYAILYVVSSYDGRHSSSKDGPSHCSSLRWAFVSSSGTTPCSSSPQSRGCAGKQADLMWRALHRRGAHTIGRADNRPTPDAVPGICDPQERTMLVRQVVRGGRSCIAVTCRVTAGRYLAAALNSGAGSPNLDHVGSDQRHWCIRQRVDLAG